MRWRPGCPATPTWTTRRRRRARSPALRVAVDLQSCQRLAHRHHLEAVDVQVRRQVGDPPHRFGDVACGDRMRAGVEGVGCGLVSAGAHQGELGFRQPRSEEHTSELQSLMRISYAVFCLKKKKKTN